LGHPPVPAGDDRTIPDTAILWRRISPEWWQRDPSTGEYRLTSAAFQNYRNSNAMSVGIADEIDGREETFLKGHEGYGIAAFKAGSARADCNQTVTRAPENEQPWHAHVLGKKTGSVQKCLKSASTIVVTPRA
jgi:hypothetical protein